MDNDLTAKIRNHPSYDNDIHSTLVEVIEREYSPEQLSIMMADPVLDSLVGGMIASMRATQLDDDNETATHKYRLAQAEELMRKGWAFLNHRVQEARNAGMERKTA